jgi:LmbE family N-acetylglucosaminyl deacetylase
MLAKYSILAVFAHPDDEMSVSAMLAKYAHEGHDVYLASVTSGQKGVRAHFGMLAGDELGAVREAELRCAARQLGIHEPFLLGYQDQGISSAQVADEIAGRVRELFEQTRPDVVITWGPDGVTGHVDHGATGAIVTLAFQQQGLLHHKPRKLYYLALPESRMLAVPEPVRRKRPLYTVSDRFVTTVVDCREFVEQGLKAIECHRSQFSPERMEQFKEMTSRVFSDRVSLRLALSTVSYANGREDSILAGLD